MKNDNFSCENCGGMMRFDSKTQSLKCENCGTEKTLPRTLTWERHRLDEYDHLLKKESDNSLTVVECQSCGATIEMDPHISSGKCPYCNSNIVISEKAVSLLEPDGLRPFRVDQRDVGRIFSNWVKKRWFAPNALKTLYQAGKIMGIYLPYWSFDNNADCDYTALGGIDRTETYYEDGKEKTRIVTDWYSVRGNVQNDFKNIIMRASRSLKDNLLKSLGGFDLENTINFDTGYLSGYASEVFQVPMREGYVEAKEVMENELEGMVRSDVLRRYDRVKSISMNIYWSDEFYRLLMLPVYSTSYSFNGKSYQVLINGENGTVVGEYPKSIIKITLAIIAAIIVICILYFLFFKD